MSNVEGKEGRREEGGGRKNGRTKGKRKVARKEEEGRRTKG